MADKCYIVVAECIDQRNGKRYFSGDVFDPAPDAKQADRLINAGCIEEQDAATVEQVDIDTATVPMLKEIATLEEIDLTGLTAKADILAAIKASRAAKADGLDATSEEGLAKIVADEAIEVPAGADHAATVAAIRAARASKAAQA